MSEYHPGARSPPLSLPLGVTNPRNDFSPERHLSEYSTSAASAAGSAAFAAYCLRSSRSSACRSPWSIWRLIVITVAMPASSAKMPASSVCHLFKKSDNHRGSRGLCKASQVATRNPTTDAPLSALRIRQKPGPASGGKRPVSLNPSSISILIIRWRIRCITPRSCEPNPLTRFRPSGCDRWRCDRWHVPTSCI